MLLSQQSTFQRHNLYTRTNPKRTCTCRAGIRCTELLPQCIQRCSRRMSSQRERLRACCIRCSQWSPNPQNICRLGMLHTSPSQKWACRFQDDTLCMNRPHLCSLHRKSSPRCQPMNLRDPDRRHTLQLLPLLSRTQLRIPHRRQIQTRPCRILPRRQCTCHPSPYTQSHKRTRCSRLPNQSELHIPHRQEPLHPQRTCPPGTAHRHQTLVLLCKCPLHMQRKRIRRR
mmetsp:Transcript_62831/g.92097  ORF Transcript_62831/g.92097 Transcript_62831/m.92097 type:complete len:228 (-) Transcript_62831:330-1013(-)